MTQTALLMVLQDGSPGTLGDAQYGLLEEGLHLAEGLLSRVTDEQARALSVAQHQAQAQARGLMNITVMTEDMNTFEPDGQFDRVVSIEMFEHMRNYERLFDQISSWLVADGLLFFHIFCHRNQPYFFEDESQEDWMARHFFTGGLMPSLDLPKQFEGRLLQRQYWVVNGQHYANTCKAWLKNLDQHKTEIVKTLDASDNPDPAIILLQRWRMFVMACQEMFAYQGGETWMVGHFLFEKAAEQDDRQTSKEVV